MIVAEICGDAAGVSRAAPFLFDLDGTIIDTELLPLIGRELGLERELERLTRLTMDGVLPFETSFRYRVDLLKATPISRVQEIVASAPLNPEIADFIAANRDRCLIVTGNCDVWIAPLVQRLGCRAVFSRTLSDGDRLLQVEEIVDKGAVARRFGGSAVAVGDGHNDLEMFRASRFSVAYGGVHRPAASLLTVATHVIYESTTLCRFLQRLC